MANERKDDKSISASDALPDDLRRRDVVDPDALPAIEDADTAMEDIALSPDGGSPDHPIHDEPMEDLQPEDYEAMIDDAEKIKLERRVDEDTMDLRATQEFAAGSSDPLDQSTPPPINRSNS
jgi:hypothetical protein